MTKTPEDKTLEELAHDAVILHGMIEGLEILHDDNSEAGRNAVSAFMEVVKRRADCLAFALNEGRRREEAAQ